MDGTGSCAEIVWDTRLMMGREEKQLKKSRGEVTTNSCRNIVVKILRRKQANAVLLHHTEGCRVS